MPMLRQELHSLKTCQFAFLTTAFTTTGVLLGFLAKFGSAEYADFVFLAPLVVILPCFCFFFDKASTITRIVGYYRILEDISGNTRFVGWENSLYKSRNKDEKIPLDFFSLIKRIVLVKKPYGYWSLAFNTFLTLILICILCALFCPNFNKGESNYLEIHWIVLLFSIVFSAVCIIRNFYIVKSLMAGESSYEKNYENWKKILKITYR
jgi:hypothetical protein